MKIFIVLCVALSIVVALSEASEVMDNYKKVLKDCMKERNESNEDFIKMVDENDAKLNCLIACADKKWGAFDGKTLNSEKVHEITMAELTDRNMEYTADMRTAMDKCIDMVNKHDGDECKKIEVAFKCIREDAKLAVIETKEEWKKLIAA